MLPGFRILFAIVFLSVSVLVFGVGAAAFLRAAHDNLASTPAYRPIELAYAPRIELPRTETLSMMRVQTPAELGGAELQIDQPASLTVSPRDDRAPADAAPPAAAAPAVEPAAPVAETPKADDLTTASTPSPAAAAEAAKLPAAPETPSAPVPDMPVASIPDTVPAPVLSETDMAKTSDAPGQDSLTAADRSDAHATGPLAALQGPAPAPTEPHPAQKPAALEAATPAPADAASKPEHTAALAEPAIPAQPPLPISAVRIPKPRIDPKVIETQQREERARKQRAARAQIEARAKARRAAAVRARAAATAQARTADPFAPTPFQQPAATR